MVKIETVNGSRKVITTANDATGPFTSTVWVNNGETITGVRAQHGTQAGAIKWAKKQLSK